MNIARRAAAIAALAVTLTACTQASAAGTSPAPAAPAAPATSSGGGGLQFTDPTGWINSYGGTDDGTDSGGSQSLTRLVVLENNGVVQCEQETRGVVAVAVGRSVVASTYLLLPAAMCGLH